jgi:hypothetical protein
MRAPVGSGGVVIVRCRRQCVTLLSPTFHIVQVYSKGGVRLFSGYKGGLYACDYMCDIIIDRLYMFL